MKRLSLLIPMVALVLVLFAVGCSAAAPSPTKPTPNIDATVEAKVKQELAAQLAQPAQPANAPAPTFRVVKDLANTPEAPKPIPKEAMPEWATEDDCEIHHVVLLVCAHMIKHPHAGFLIIEATISNLSSQFVEDAQAYFDTYKKLTGDIVGDGIMNASRLPPGITYEDLTGPLAGGQNPRSYNVVISKSCLGAQCEYGHYYLKP